MPHELETFANGQTAFASARLSAWHQLGTVTHRGAEASLSGSPLEGLSMIVGMVWLRPRVTGQAVDDGRIGPRPIGRTPLFIDASADYRIPGLSGVSVDAHATYEARRTANAANTASLPSRAISVCTVWLTPKPSLPCP